MVIKHRTQLDLANPFYSLFSLFSHVFSSSIPLIDFLFPSCVLCPKHCMVSLAGSQNAIPIASLHVSYTIGNNHLQFVKHLGDSFLADFTPASKV